MAQDAGFANISFVRGLSSIYGFQN